MRQSGADILRLWVVASDYAEDLRIGPEILKHHERRLPPPAQHAALPAGRARPASRRRKKRSRRRRCRSWSAGCCTAWPSSTNSSGRSIDAYDFHGMFTALHNFCAVDLSAPSISTSARTGSIATALDDLHGAARRARCSTAAFDCLVRWLAPILCFTAEEAWLARHGDDDRSAASISNCSPRCRAPGATRRSASAGPELRDLRRRRDRRARSRARRKSASGRACRRRSRLFVPERLVAICLRDVDLAELCITSAGTVQAGAAAGGRVHPCRMSPDIGVRRVAGARRRAASAAGGCCRKSAMCRVTTICAAAAPSVIDRGVGRRLPLSRAG